MSFLPEAAQQLEKLSSTGLYGGKPALLVTSFVSEALKNWYYPISSIYFR